MNMDRISGLSRETIGNILSRMPLRDAARTSILSRTWRYLWTSCPAISLNRQFYERNFRNKNRKHFVNSVNRILSVHVGPIHSLVLYIPRFDSFDMTCHVHRWIRIALSWNALENLQVYNQSCCFYKLTKHAFGGGFPLTNLLLNTCRLEPPRRCAGFSNLEILRLWKISLLSNQFEVFLPSARVLKMLSVVDCYGRFNLRGDAPNLHTLFVRCNRYAVFALGLFGSNPSLECVNVAGTDTLDNAEHGNAANLSKFLSSMPKVSSLGLSGSNLKLLASGTVPESLANPLNLTNLKIYDFRFKDLDQMSAVLCLLRNSPKLRGLSMTSCTSKPLVAEAEIVDYLESPTTLEHLLGQLQTIELSELEVSRVALVFVKLLLAKTPLLEVMKIGVMSPGTDAAETSGFSAEIMGFPRASNIPNCRIDIHRSQNPS